MDESQLRRDVEYLSNRLMHRRANTESERLAAEYVRDRFREYAPDVSVEDFFSIDSFAYLFASYYVEFFMVAVLSAWIPWAAFVYGLVMFILYMMEFTGTPAMSRLMPQFETQNVSARFISAMPRRLLVITANYDSPRATAWSKSGPLGRINLIHLVIVVCMVTIVVSCAADGLGVLADSELRFDRWIRWFATGVLIMAAVTLYTTENRGELSRGANNNASGTSLLLHLARRFQAEPLVSTDVLIVSTGAKECWHAGMRHLMRSVSGNPQRIYFVNITGVGAGDLRYTTGEGMLHVFPASKELLALARQCAGPSRVTPLVYRGIPTDALIPLARGRDTLGIMGTGATNMPVDWGSASDTAGQIDYDVLARACGFAESLARELDKSMVSQTSRSGS